MKIGQEDYTVHSIVAVDHNGDRYYDHKLSHIEKGKLLDQINGGAVGSTGFGTTPDTKSTTRSERKLNELNSLLQITDEEVLFRDDTDPIERVSVRDSYEKAIAGSLYQAQEAFQDSMLGLTEASISAWATRPGHSRHASSEPLRTRERSCPD